MALNKTTTATGVVTEAPPRRLFSLAVLICSAGCIELQPGAVQVGSADHPAVVVSAPASVPYVDVDAQVGSETKAAAEAPATGPWAEVVVTSPVKLMSRVGDVSGGTIDVTKWGPWIAAGGVVAIAIIVLFWKARWPRET